MYNVNLIYLKIGFFFLLQLSSFIVYKWMLSCIEVVLFNNRYLLSFCPLYSDVFHFFSSLSLSLSLSFALSSFSSYIFKYISSSSDTRMQRVRYEKVFVYQNVFEYLFS